MTFTFPIAFLALPAVAALVLIYWLRSRHKRQPVSTLILWMDQRESRDGGLLVHRLQTPLLFFLELLTLLLLILAAARPAFTAGRAAATLVVVLDDSYSMLAGGRDSPKNAGKSAVEREISGVRYSSVRFVVAGNEPQILGDASESSSTAALDGWSCNSPNADLEEAIAFGLTVGGDLARLLVVTDKAPPEEPADGRIQWWAFGSPRRNVAFVNAARTPHAGQERCLLEIANLSNSATKTGLAIEAAGSSGNESHELQRASLDLAPNETRRLVLKLPSNVNTLRARLDDDVLPIDNQVILLPEPRPQVRVELRFADDSLGKLVEKAVSASESALVTSINPELVLTDQDSDASDASTAWVMRMISEGDARSYIGPFVVDRAHPLTRGLSLDGVVWGAGQSLQSGNAVIAAGNVPLLTDIERADGRHDLRLRLRPELSTLQDTPNWPVLIWNVLDLRAANSPGLTGANLRLGDNGVLTVRPTTRSVEVRSPEGASREVVAQGRTVNLKADRAGVYEIVDGEYRHRFASNTLTQEESDLSLSASGRWGSWAASGLQTEQQNIGWLFLLLALLALAIHQALTARLARADAR